MQFRERTSPFLPTDEARRGGYFLLTNLLFEIVPDGVWPFGHINATAARSLCDVMLELRTSVYTGQRATDQYIRGSVLQISIYRGSVLQISINGYTEQRTTDQYIRGSVLLILKDTRGGPPVLPQGALASFQNTGGILPYPRGWTQPL